MQFARHLSVSRVQLMDADTATASFHKKAVTWIYLAGATGGLQPIT